MVEDYRERGHHATASWHSCPLCHTKRLTSAPDEPVVALSSLPRPGDDGSGYAGDPAFTGPDLEA